MAVFMSQFIMGQYTDSPSDSAAHYSRVSAYNSHHNHLIDSKEGNKRQVINITASVSELTLNVARVLSFNLK